MQILPGALVTGVCHTNCHVDGPGGVIGSQESGDVVVFVLGVNLYKIASLELTDAIKRVEIVHHRTREHVRVTVERGCGYEDRVQETVDRVFQRFEVGDLRVEREVEFLLRVLQKLFGLLKLCGHGLQFCGHLRLGLVQMVSRVLQVSAHLLLVEVQLFQGVQNFLDVHSVEGCSRAVRVGHQVGQIGTNWINLALVKSQMY